MTIEPGKYYIRLDGNVVGPVKEMNPCFSDIVDSSIYPFVCLGHSYRRDGKHCLDGKPHPYDLIKEVIVTISN